MYLDNIATPKRLLRNYELLIKAVSGYSTKIDIIRDNLADVVTTWSWDNQLSSFTHEGLTTEEDLHIYSVTKPVDFAHDINNSLYFSVYNISYLGTDYVGEITDTSVITTEDFDQVFGWGYDATNLYLFIPVSGLAEEKYLFWLPKNFTTEEESTFFNNKTHRFVLDYKLST